MMYPNEKYGPPPPYGFNPQGNMRVQFQQQSTYSDGFSTHTVSSSSSGPITSHGEPIVSVMYSSSILSHYPVSIQCPSCEKQVVTRVEYETGAGTWLISLVICIFGGFLGCCLIPFCISSCQDAVHHCPACSNYIGRRNLM